MGNFNKLIVVNILIFFHFNLIGQISHDELVRIVKSTMFNSIDRILGYENTEKAERAFFQLQFSFDTLFGSGLNNPPLLFLKISPTFSTPQNVSLEKTPFIDPKCEGGFIIGINEDRIVYRLGGFTQNDFPSLFRWIKSQNRKRIKSFKWFKSEYYIEGLDFKCLYKAHRRFSNDESKYPCLYKCTKLIITY